MPIIQVKDLQKNFSIKTKQPGLKGSVRSIFRPEFKHIEAVNGISFEVEEGEMLAFIGPNGAGKSTTIKMMTGILYPTSGDINVLGFNPMKERKKLSYQIGTVFGQKSQLWFHLPPYDSFKLLGHIYEVEEQKLNKRIAFLTEIFEIEELLNIPVRKLSLGQRIRCEIAASLLHEPKIIFFDEPTIGLDVIVKQKIRDLIKQINQEEKTTIFLTSHDAGDIEELCRRVIVINHGDIVTDDSVKNLKSDYLKNKIIQVQYKEKVDLQMEHVKILKNKGYDVKIEVDTFQMPIDEVITKLTQLGKVVDITIEDPPLEEIIADIYKTKKGVSDGGS